jgi:hypothetical protein
LVTDKDEGIKETVLELQRLFPKGIEYGDWDVWDNLQNLNNINLVAEDDDGQIIGYTLVISQTEAVGYLKEKDDPLIEDCAEMCHVDQLVVVKDRRGGEVVRLLIEEIIVESQKRGYKKGSSYLVMELTGTLRRMFKGKIIRERNVRLDRYGNHDLIYLEAWF